MKYFSALLLTIFLSCKAPSELDNSADLEITKVLYKVGEPKLTTSKPRFDESLLTFELLYNKEKSVFRLQDKLIDDVQNNDYKITSIIYGGNFIYYKNNVANEKIFNVSFNGDVYNVSVPFQQYNWSISNETKIIEGFKCYKATAEFTQKDLKTNRIIQYNPIVWFTTEIPTSFGPRGLDGLPGLVLEGTFDGRKTFYATKISQEKNTIQKPKCNLSMQEEEFSAVMLEFSKEREKISTENAKEIQLGKKLISK